MHKRKTPVNRAQAERPPIAPHRERLVDLTSDSEGMIK
jgi:hypothetical protein